MENLYVKNKLEQVKREGYGLHLEGVLSNAFDIHKKSILPGLLATFLYLFVMMVVAFLMFEHVYGVNVNEFVDLLQRNPQALESSMANIPLTSKLIYAGVSSLAAAFVAPLLSGLYKVAFNTQYGVNGSTSDLFAYYKQPYFMNIFIYSFLFSVVLQLINIGLEQAIPGMGSFVGVLLQIIAGVTFVFTVPFIVFGNMNWIQALKASTTVTSKNWFFLLFILAIAFIIFVIGIFFCGIGILFTYPFMFFVTFILYNTIIGFPNTKDDISKIGEE